MQKNYYDTIMHQSRLHTYLATQPGPTSRLLKSAPMNRMYMLEVVLSHSQAAFGSIALKEIVMALSGGGLRAGGKGPVRGLR